MSRSSIEGLPTHFPQPPAADAADSRVVQPCPAGKIGSIRVVRQSRALPVVSAPGRNGKSFFRPSNLFIDNVNFRLYKKRLATAVTTSRTPPACRSTGILVRRYRRDSLKVYGDPSRPAIEKAVPLAAHRHAIPGPCCSRVRITTFPPRKRHRTGNGPARPTPFSSAERIRYTTSYRRELRVGPWLRRLSNLAYCDHAHDADARPASRPAVTRGGEGQKSDRRPPAEERRPPVSHTRELRGCSVTAATRPRSRRYPDR